MEVTNENKGNNKELDEETLFVVSQTFKAVDDPTRILFSIYSLIKNTT